MAKILLRVQSPACPWDRKSPDVNTFKFLTLRGPEGGPVSSWESALTLGWPGRSSALRRCPAPAPAGSGVAVRAVPGRGARGGEPGPAAGSRRLAAPASRHRDFLPPRPAGPQAVTPPPLGLGPGPRPRVRLRSTAPRGRPGETRMARPPSSKWGHVAGRAREQRFPRV